LTEQSTGADLVMAKTAREACMTSASERRCFHRSLPCGTATWHHGWPPDAGPACGRELKRRDVLWFNEALAARSGGSAHASREA